jgi:hypothetical protein
MKITDEGAGSEAGSVPKSHGSGTLVPTLYRLRKEPVPGQSSDQILELLPPGRRRARHYNRNLNLINLQATHLLPVQSRTDIPLANVVNSVC